MLDLSFLGLVSIILFCHKDIHLTTIYYRATHMQCIARLYCKGVRLFPKNKDTFLCNFSQTLKLIDFCTLLIWNVDVTSFTAKKERFYSVTFNFDLSLDLRN